jgi:hypothetical protein
MAQQSPCFASVSRVWASLVANRLGICGHTDTRMVPTRVECASGGCCPGWRMMRSQFEGVHIGELHEAVFCAASFGSVILKSNLNGFYIELLLR